MRIGTVRLREADDRDVEHLLTFRNDPDVTRFMIRTSVDPAAFRAEWQAVPASSTDFSCVAEDEDGVVVAIGFLDLHDGAG